MDYATAKSNKLIPLEWRAATTAAMRTLLAGALSRERAFRVVVRPCARIFNRMPGARPRAYPRTCAHACARPKSRTSRLKKRAGICTRRHYLALGGTEMRRPHKRIPRYSATRIATEIQISMLHRRHDGSFDTVINCCRDDDRIVFFFECVWINYHIKLLIFDLRQIKITAIKYFNLI